MYVLKRDKEISEVELSTFSREMVEEMFLDEMSFCLSKYKQKKDLNDLARLDEVIEFYKIFKGYSSLSLLREEHKKEKGLYWKIINRFCY